MYPCEMSFNIGNKKLKKTVCLPDKIHNWLTVFGKWSAKRFPRFFTWTDSCCIGRIEQ